MPTTAGSPASSSSTATSSSEPKPSSALNPDPNGANNPMQSWWESISRARSRIQSLADLLGEPAIALLADSDQPARSLLSSSTPYDAISAAITAPASGSGDDSLCHWLYDTFQSPDPDLRLVPISFVPLIAGVYLSRVVSGGSSGVASSLAGFEAVLLAVYTAETKARGGRPVLISIPDLSQPSLYHTPRNHNPNRNPHPDPTSDPQQRVGVLSPPLEPQIAVKSTKRACIVAVALDCFYKKISLMPSSSKVDLCEFVASWAGQDCPCRFELDKDLNSSSSASFSNRNLPEANDEIGNAAEDFGGLAISERTNGCSKGDIVASDRVSRGSRVPLPWELLQPVLRVLGHCLLAPLNPQEVRDAASLAVRCVYARASHDLLPQGILAARSLIQLDKSARVASKAVALATTPNSASNPNTPTKPKKPEILLVSK